ncbi:MAG: glycosyltransferase family 9 protein, partial [Deltaproteobacteria bacterium]|nr:glycosyltransferase family 9 protein [Deltaproteobacteria bacterium]
IRDLRGTTFDKLLNLYRVSSLPGAGKMGLLFSLLKAETRIGHDRYGFGWFLTEGIPAGTFTGQHIAEAMLEIAARAGGIPDGEGIEVFWNADIASRWNDFFVPLTGKAIVGINPGGDRENRRWAPDRFASVAEEIIGRFNAAVILLGGPAEVHIASDIAGRIRSDVFNLAGKTSVDALPYIISRMDLLITNDSGPMHIAAATKTPLVALFGPEDPKLFGPYTDPERYRVIHKYLPYLPCGDTRCKPLSCMELITSEEVSVACIELLQNLSLQGPTV